jgi:hypothetical protein
MDLKANWLMVVALVLFAAFILWVSRVEPARSELWSQYTMNDLRGH